MNVTALVIIAVCTGLFLVGVLAEPWQRPRYDATLAEARQRLSALMDEDFDAELDTLVLSDEMRREAQGGC